MFQDAYGFTQSHALLPQLIMTLRTGYPGSYITIFVGGQRESSVGTGNLFLRRPAPFTGLQSVGRDCWPLLGSQCAAGSMYGHDTDICRGLAGFMTWYGDHKCGQHYFSAMA